MTSPPTATSAIAAGASTESAQLTSPSAVLAYTKDTPFRAVKAHKLTGGMINFVYRLFLSDGISSSEDADATQQSITTTAILKHAAPYTASNPAFKLASDRLVYEARALRHVPWRTFVYPQQVHGLCPGVVLPEVYFEDVENSTILMQDMAMIETGEPPVHLDSFSDFCEGAVASERKRLIAQAIGTVLGSFFVQLHDWGRRTESHTHVRSLFEGNGKVVELMLDVHLGCLFKNVTKAGYKLSPDQERALRVAIAGLNEAVVRQQDTAVLADIRSVTNCHINCFCGLHVISFANPAPQASQYTA
jgi:hypothetical protein